MTLPRQTQDGETRAQIDVLVVDDSDLARGAVVRTLTRAGLLVDELATPIGLTHALLRRRVRLVLIDYDMPSLRGDRVIALLRGNPRFRETKVALMSGNELKELRGIGVAAGADAVVAKSDGPDALLAVVRSLLASGAASAG